MNDRRAAPGPRPSLANFPHRIIDHWLSLQANSRRPSHISRSIRLSPRGSRYVTCRFSRLFRCSRRQTADDYKRDQNGNKNSKLQHVHHAHSPSPGMGWHQVLRSNPGSLATFAAIRRASSRGLYRLMRGGAAGTPLVPLGEKDDHKLRCGELMRPVREGPCGYK